MRNTVIKQGVSYALDHVITTGGNCTAEGPCYYEEICPTMKAAGAHAVATIGGAADSSTGIQRTQEASDSSGRNVRCSDPSSSQSLSKQKVSVKTESEILCLNDQGGSVMHIHYGITEPLRAQMKHHEPIVLVYESHGQDARYRELEEINETVSAKYGTGGGNMPIVVEKEAKDNGDVYREEIL